MFGKGDKPRTFSKKGYTAYRESNLWENLEKEAREQAKSADIQKLSKP